MNKLSIGVSILFLFLNATSALSQLQKQQHILITTQFDTLKSIKVLPSKKLTNETQVTFLNKKNKRVVLPASKVHSFYDGTYHVSESIGKRKTNQVIISYDVRGPLSFGYSRTRSGDYNFYLKQGTEVLEIPKEEEKVYKKVVGYVINGDSFANYYRKNIYPEYKSLAEFASAYNAYVSPDKYKAKKYTYLENPKPSAFVAINYDDMKVQSFRMNYSFNFGVSFENAYSRKLKVMFIPNFGIAKFNSDLVPFEVDIKTLGLEGALGWSLKGDQNKLDLVVGPTLGAKYFFDSQIVRSIGKDINGETIFKAQAIETLKMSYGAAAWLKINDKLSASLRYTTYGVRFSSSVLDNIEGADNEFIVDSYQIGVHYRLN